MNQKDLLRRAIDNEPVPRDLEAKIRVRLEGPASPGRGSPRTRLISSLAMLAVVAGGMQFYSVRRINELLGVGVRDHVHCAMEGTYPRQSQRVEMLEGLGPQFAPMLQPVLDAAGTPGIDAVVSAHRCTIEGRFYVHIILRRGQTLLSVILTRRGERDIFPRAIAARVVHPSGISMHEGDFDGYAVASFEAGAYLGYIVSGMPDRQNDELAARLVPIVERYTHG